MRLALLVLSIVLALGKLAEASQQVCRVVINLKTGEILDEICVPGGEEGGTEILVIQEYVHSPSSASAPLSLSMPYPQFTAQVGGNRTSFQKQTITRVKTKLRSQQTVRKLHDALRLSGHSYSMGQVEAACITAGKSVEDARLLRDGKTPPDQTWMGMSDPYFMQFTQSLRPRIFIDLDFTEVGDDAWRANPGSPEPANTLGSVLFHEGLHACMQLMGIPGDQQHDIMDPISGLAPRCGNPPCDWRWEKDIKERTDSIIVNHLHRYARNQLELTIPAGSLIRDPRTGEEAVVHRGHAFPLPRDLSAEDRARISDQPNKVTTLWEDVIVDMSAPPDGLIVGDGDGRLVRFAGGAVFSVPDLAALRRISYHGDGKFRTLWKGAFDRYPATPRDGTILWEHDDGGSSALYVMLGGARFLLPSDKIAKAMGHDAIRAVRMWEGSTARLPTVPRDGSVFLYPSGALFFIKNGVRYRLPDASWIRRLGASTRDLRFIWEGAIDALPERAADCELEVTAFQLSSPVVVLGETAPAVAHFEVANNGLLASQRSLNLRARLNGVIWPAGWIQLPGELASGKRKKGQIEIQTPPRVGNHTVRIEIEQADSCDGNAANNFAEGVLRVQAGATPPSRQADLTVTLEGMDRTTLVYATKEWTWARYKVTNSGTQTVTSPSGYIVVSIIVDGERRQGQLVVPTPLSPGASSRVEQFAVDSSPIPRGRHELWLEVNPDFEPLPELRRDNNLSRKIVFEVR